MRRIIGLSLAGVLVAVATAAAQYQIPSAGTPWGGGYGGNLNQYGGINAGASGAFRGPNAPLSPYLNLLGGGNPATNYYNFVRPNTFSPFRSGAFSPFAGGGGGRQTFFPTLGDIEEEDFQRSTKYRPEGEKEDRVHMAPTGHPAAYGNTMGYFGLQGGGTGSAGSHSMKPTGTPSSGRGRR
jgi:hypothetical protein